MCWENHAEYVIRACVLYSLSGHLFSGNWGEPLGHTWPCIGSPASCCLPQIHPPQCPVQHAVDKLLQALTDQTPRCTTSVESSACCKKMADEENVHVWDTTLYRKCSCIRHHTVSDITLLDICPKAKYIIHLSDTTLYQTPVLYQICISHHTVSETTLYQICIWHHNVSDIHKTPVSDSILRHTLSDTHQMPHSLRYPSNITPYQHTTLLHDCNRSDNTPY